MRVLDDVLVYKHLLFDHLTRQLPLTALRLNELFLDRFRALLPRAWARNLRLLRLLPAETPAFFHILQHSS